LDEYAVVRFVRRELDPERAADVERHLASCEACLELVAHTLHSSLAVPDSDAVPVHPGDRVDRYLLLEPVGMGAMGMVFAAYDPELARKVAIKLLRAERSAAPAATELQARFVREAQAMAKLVHPNVVAVHDVGTFPGGFFVAMDLVDGTNLRAWLSEKPRTWLEIRDAFIAAGRGLAAAHRAGVVHRDFKPENVLVDGQGHVLVTDFGLAQWLGEDAPSGAADPITEVGRLTATGAVVGTPAYMAPEQLDGGPVDARADLFAFSVALYEALYGESPFPTDDFARRVRAIRSGEAPPRPRSVKVPGRLRAVILRGLRPDPADRPTSIDALLEALAFDPNRWRRWVLASLGAVVAAVAAVLAYRSLAPQASTPCAGAEAKLTGAWDDARRREVQEAFKRTGASFAEGAAAVTAQVLDAYAVSWAAAHVDACEATRVRGEQSEALLDRRMRCLAERLRSLRALTAVFAAPDATLVEKAVAAAYALPSIAACADPERLAPRWQPKNADEARRSEAAREGLAEARAVRDAGRYPAGQERIAKVVGEARALGDRALLGAALFVRGGLQQATTPGSATASFIEAAAESTAAKDDARAAKALGAAANTLGWHEGKTEESLRWVEYARGSFERAGADEELRAYFANVRANIYSAADQPDRALPLHREALRGLQRLYGEVHPRVATALNAIAIDLAKADRNQEALGMFEQARAMHERLQGPEHPETLKVLGNIALMLGRLGRREEALAIHLRELSVSERVFGPDHLELARTLQNLGALYVDLKRPADAVIALERAGRLQRVHARSHSAYLETRSSLATALAASGRTDEALALARGTLAEAEKVHGGNHALLRFPLYALGKANEARLRFSEAHEAYARALRVFAAEERSGHLEAADYLDARGRTLRLLGHPRAAAADHGRALSIRERNLDAKSPLIGQTVVEVAEDRLALGDRVGAGAAAGLARALLDPSKPSQARAYGEASFALARTLGGVPAGRRAAAEALAALRRGKGIPREALREVERWIARHRSSR
jgi:tetratricopeptide (TPR) repeat protein